MNNNLAIILNNNFSVSGVNVNISNNVSTISKKDLNKLKEFFKNKIKIAIKADKVKMAIGNIIINSIGNNNGDRKMTIQKTYIATVKKNYIEKARKFYNNINNLNLLVDKVIKKETSNEDNFFKEMNVFKEIPDAQTLQQKVETNLNDLEMQGTIAPDKLVNPVEFNSVNNLQPINQNSALTNSDPLPVNNNDINNIPTFNAGKEGNLNYALGDETDNKMYNTSKINLNDIPSQTIDKTIAENNIGNSGHIKGKLVAFIVIVLFVSSCIFLGYEITKMSEVMPLIKDKYF